MNVHPPREDAKTDVDRKSRSPSSHRRSLRLFLSKRRRSKSSNPPHSATSDDESIQVDYNPTTVLYRPPSFGPAGDNSPSSPKSSDPASLSSQSCQSVQAQRPVSLGLRRRQQARPGSALAEARTLALCTGVVCQVEPATNYRLISRQSFRNQLPSSSESGSDPLLSLPASSSFPTPISHLAKSRPVPERLTAREAMSDSSSQDDDLQTATGASITPRGSTLTKALGKIALLEAQLRFRELQLIRAGLKTEEDLTIFKETPPPSSCLGTMHEHPRDLFLPIVAWLSSLALLAYFSPAAVNEVVFELWPQHGLSDPSNLEFFHNQETDTWGFGCCYPEAKEAVISFRGTISDENWSTNLDIKLSPLNPILGDDPVHYPAGYSDLLVHQGFNRALLSIWPSVYKFIQTCRS